MEAIETVRNLEAELETKRREAGRVLRSARRRLKLTMRDVAPKVKMSAATIHNVEKCKVWKTKTAQRLARFYEQQNAA